MVGFPYHMFFFKATKYQVLLPSAQLRDFSVSPAPVSQEYILLSVLLHVFVGLKRTWDMKLALVNSQGLNVLNLAISGDLKQNITKRFLELGSWTKNWNWVVLMT